MFCGFAAPEVNFGFIQRFLGKEKTEANTSHNQHCDSTFARFGVTMMLNHAAKSQKTCGTIRKM